MKQKLNVLTIGPCYWFSLRLRRLSFPRPEVRNGPKILRSMHVQCMLDTLLKSTTITEAWRDAEDFGKRATRNIPIERLKEILGL